MLEQFFDRREALRRSMEEFEPNRRVRSLNTFQGVVELMKDDKAGLHPMVQFACYFLYTKLVNQEMYLQVGEEVPELMLTQDASPTAERPYGRIGVAIPSTFLEQLTESPQNTARNLGIVAYIAGKSLALMEGVSFTDEVVEERARVMRADVLLSVQRQVPDIVLDQPERQYVQEYPNGLAGQPATITGLRMNTVQRRPNPGSLN